MPERVSIQFSTGCQENAEQFIEESILDALNRVPEMDACDSFTFVPGQPTTGDRTAGLQTPPPDHPIYLTIRGETDEIIDAERNRWNVLVEDGVVTEWEAMKSTDREEMVEELGEERATLLARSSNLSAQMAKLAIEEFDELGIVPAAVETYPDAESKAAPFGWWSVLHTVTVQLNYSLGEELDAYRYGIEHVLRNVTEIEGKDEAEELLDETIDALEAIRAEVKEGRLDT